MGCDDFGEFSQSLTKPTFLSETGQFSSRFVMHKKPQFRRPNKSVMPTIGAAAGAKIYRSGVPAFQSKSCYNVTSERTGRSPVAFRRDRHHDPNFVSDGRKVRAPQDRTVDNVHRPRGQGKCNRKQTAPDERLRAFVKGKGETVR